MPLRSAKSTLASVVISEPTVLKKWSSTKLDSFHPLDQFHKKFWGKSMVMEERNAQRHGNSHLDHGEGDDIQPGCYALDIGIRGIHTKKIWIRAEYIEIYDHFETHYLHTQGPGRRPGGVLTGQPGIGKSTWIYYAIRRRLGEGKPVIWYRRKTLFLFVKEGVFRAPPDFELFWLKTFTWTMVDSDESEACVPPELIFRSTSLFVIYVSSPVKRRWSRMHNTVRRSVAVMNSWTRQEIYQAAPLILDDPDLKLINRIYDLFGPTPSLCFHEAYDPGDFESYQQDLFTALCNLTPQKLEALVDESKNLDMGQISHKICLIQRANPVNPSTVHISPITDFVGSQIAIHFRDLQRGDQIQLYKNLAVIRSARGIADKIFEAYGQQLFRRQISIEYFPVVRLSDQMLRGDEVQPRRSCLSQWHSSHAALANDQLKSISQINLPGRSTLVVSPSGTCEYDEDDFKARIEPDVYYIPKSSNQAAFNSFILHDGHLFVFQFSGGTSHQIKSGLVTFLTQCANIPKRDKWRLILVIPDDVEVTKCQYSQGAELQKLALFSSVLTVEEPQWTQEHSAVVMKTTKPRRERSTAGSAIGVRSEEKGEEGTSPKRLRRSERLSASRVVKEAKAGPSATRRRRPNGRRPGLRIEAY